MARLLAWSISRIESGSEGAASAEAACCAGPGPEATILGRGLPVGDTLEVAACMIPVPTLASPKLPRRVGFKLRTSALGAPCWWIASFLLGSGPSAEKKELQACYVTRCLAPR